LVTTPLTLVSSLTGLTVTLALSNTSLEYEPQGTAGAQTATFTAGLDRSRTVVIFIGLPLATMISSLFFANTSGVPEASSSLVIAVMFLVFAEANTSARAPCLIDVASDELPA
jgi:hypothetical protein